MIKTGLTRLLLFFSLLYFSACGIDTIYYLPQVSEGSINTTFNTDATVSLRSLSEVYASGYRIYYRIYISNHDTGAAEILLESQRRDINIYLNNDFTAFYPYTDPISYSSLPDSNTFNNRNYYELELEDADISDEVLSKNGVSFRLSFPLRSGEHPRLVIPDRIGTDGEEYTRYLFRNNASSTTMLPDRYFFYSTDLDVETNHTFSINNDVIRNSAGSDHAYVSMYVVAVGFNMTNFTSIFSKPTHIGIFKLPNMN